MRLKILLLCLFVSLLLLLSTKVLAQNQTVIQSTMASTSPVVPIATTSPLFERIALCESDNNPHAKNIYSSASGRFQFTWNSWYYYGRKFWGDDFYEKNIFDYGQNTELALYVFKTIGVSPWESSRNCWGMLE